MRLLRPTAYALSTSLILGAALPAAAWEDSGPEPEPSQQSDHGGPWQLSDVELAAMFPPLPPLPDALAVGPGDEIETARTITSSTVVGTEPGTYETTLATGPLNYLDGDGHLQPLDRTWTPTTAGLTASVGDTHVLAVPTAVADGSAIVTATTPSGGRFSYGLDAENPAPVDAVPSATGAVLTFPSILPDTTLSLQALGIEVKETLRLSGPSAASAEFLFPFALDGLELQPSTDGGLELLDPAGTVQLRIGAPYMEDATGAASFDAGWTIRDGDVLALTVDVDWLTAPERQYPVLIDPTLACEGTISCGEQHSYRRDKYTEDGANSNWSTRAYLLSGAHQDPALPDAQAYLKFGDDVGDTWVPLEGRHTINSAVMKVWNTHSWGSTEDASLNCAARASYLKAILPNQSWWVDGAQFGWQDKPEFDDGVAAEWGKTTASYGTSGTFCNGANWLVYGDGPASDDDLKLTTYAQNLEDQGAYGQTYADYGFTIAGSRNAPARKQYNSWEAADHQPTLTIDWRNLPPTGADSPSPSHQQDLPGIPATLRATVRDPEGDDVRAKFTLRSPSGQQASSGLITAAHSTNASWTPPNFNEPGLYQWWVDSDDLVSTGDRSDIFYFYVDNVAPPATNVYLNMTGSQIAARSGPCPGWYRGEGALPVRWDAVADTSGNEGYRYLVNQTPDTDLDPGTPGNVYTPDTQIPDPLENEDNEYVDGAHWFHIITVDGAGNWSETTHFPLGLDRSVPPPVTIDSDTHPLPEEYPDVDPDWSLDRQVRLDHTMVGTDSGVAPIPGASVRVSQVNTDVPNRTPNVNLEEQYVSNRTEGKWWFASATVDCAGNRSVVNRFPAWVDDQAPTTPIVEASPHADPNKAYSERETTLTFTATDAGKGVQAYRYTITEDEPGDPSAATAVAPNAGSSYVATTTLPIAEGTVWVNVQASDDVTLGRWSSVGRLQINIDASAPPAPIVTSPTHSQASWSNTKRARFDITTNEPGGVAEYRYWYGTSPTAPGGLDDIDDDSYASTSLSSISLDGPEGDGYFHVVAVNKAGLVSPSARYRTRIDTVAPTGPTNLTSDTHQENVPSTDERPVLRWTQASDERSGVAGYSWTVNSSATAAADTEPELGSGATSVQVGPLADGSHYFHLRAIDAAGNAGPDQVFGPIVIVHSAVDPYFELLLSQRIAESDGLGAERFYPMWGFGLGGSAAGGVNLANGNTMVKVADHFVPGHGFDIGVDYVWNALDNGNHDGMGTGWRIGITDLATGSDYSAAGIDPNQPLQFAQQFATDPDPAAAPRLIGQTLDFTDADGTTHRFVREINGDVRRRWISPPGVDLVVREVEQPLSVPLLDPSTGEQVVEVVAFEIYRPDGVRYTARYQLGGWRIVSVRNGNGDALYYQYEDFGTPPVIRLTGIGNNRSAGDVDNPPTAYSGTMRQRVEFEYDANGRLERSVAAPGAEIVEGGQVVDLERITEFAYYPATGELSQITFDPSDPVEGQSRSLGLAYSNALLTKVTDPLGEATTIKYHDNGQFNEVTDRLENVWDIDYVDIHTGSGVTKTARLTAPASGDGPTARQAQTRYDISDRVVDESAPLAYGANITEISDLSGANVTPAPSRYDWTRNRLTKTIAPDSQFRKTDYDHLGNPTEITSPAANHASDQAQGNATSAGTSRVTTEFEYEYRQPLQTDDCADVADQPRWEPAFGEDTVTCYSYGLLMKATADADGPAPRVTEYAYSRSRLSDVIQRGDPDTATDDRTTRFIYHGPTGEGPLEEIRGARYAAGFPERTLYGDASDTQGFGYDASGVALSVTDAEGFTTDYDVDPFGRVRTVTEPVTGATWTSQYDVRGWLTASADPDGDDTLYTYDRNGNTRSIRTPEGVTSTVVYDELERPRTSKRTGADTADMITTSVTHWAPDGLVEDVTDALGHTTFNTYWPNGRLRNVTAPAADGQVGTNRADYTYGTDGRLATTTGALQLPFGDDDDRPVTTYAYAPTGAIARTTSTASDGTAEVINLYDAFGAVVQTVGPTTADGDVQRSTTVYDRFGQVSQTERHLGSAGTQLQAFGHDKSGNLKTVTRPFANNYLGNGGLIDPEPITVTTTYQYDERGLMTAANHAYSDENPGGADHHITYAYDQLGRQKLRTDLVAGSPVRTSKMRYRLDGTLDAQIESYLGGGGQVWASCFDTYDRDNRLTVTRTVEATTADADACSDGDNQRVATYGYDAGGRLDTFTETLWPSIESTSPVTRTQAFTHHDNDAWATVTHIGSADAPVTTRTLGDAGMVDKILAPWGGHEVVYGRQADGSPISIGLNDLGSATSDATAALTYARNGQPRSLTWTTPADGVVRRHSDAVYDNRGLRTEETVLAVKAGTGSAASLTIEGQAGLAYDTGGRLKSYIAPFGVENGEAPQAALNYHLDDAGNVVEHTVATTAQPAVARRARQAKVGQTMVPRPGQIVEAVLTSKPENGVATVSLETATFDGTGFEVTRRVEPGAGGNPQVTTNIPGPGGFIAATLVDGPDADETAEVTVEYLYDPASERLLRRTERRPGQTDRVRMYFTLAGGARVEETDGAGATLRRWLPGATNLAEQVFELDPTSGDRAGNSRADWIWLLTDLDGNVATQLRGANDTPGDDDATILSTSPYSPYGTPGGGGTSTSSAITDTTPGSLLGFDGAHTDDVTGNLLLGPRQYDPGALRFTSADYFPSGTAQMGIGVDPLTGGNYLFAAANPIAFSDDGHRFDKNDPDFTVLRLEQQRSRAFSCLAGGDCDGAPSDVAAFMAGPGGEDLRENCPLGGACMAASLEARLLWSLHRDRYDWIAQYPDGEEYDYLEIRRKRATRLVRMTPGTATPSERTWDDGLRESGVLLGLLSAPTTGTVLLLGSLLGGGMSLLGGLTDDECPTSGRAEGLGLSSSLGVGRLVPGPAGRVAGALAGPQIADRTRELTC